MNSRQCHHKSNSICAKIRYELMILVCYADDSISWREMHYEHYCRLIRLLRNQNNKIGRKFRLNRPFTRSTNFFLLLLTCQIRSHLCPIRLCLRAITFGSKFLMLFGTFAAFILLYFTDDTHGHTQKWICSKCDNSNDKQMRIQNNRISSYVAFF